MGQVDFIAGRLASYPADVRRDFATVLQVALRECPRRWTRAGGVQDLWVALHDSPGNRVSVRRPARRSLVGYRYADDIHATGRVFDADVDREMEDNRCLALLFGNGWRSFRLPLMSNSDNAVSIVAKHRSGARFQADISFTRRRFRRIRFDHRMHQMVAGILAGDRPGG